MFAIVLSSMVTPVPEPPPFGLLDAIPPGERTVLAGHAPRDCLLSDEVHAIARASPPEVEGLHRALECRQTGPIDPMDAPALLALGKAAIAEADARYRGAPVDRGDLRHWEATLRMVDVYALGDELRSSTVMTARVGVELQLLVLDALEPRIADRWVGALAFWALAEVVENKRPMSFVPERVWIEQLGVRLYGPISRWNPVWRWHAAGMADTRRWLAPSAASEDWEELRHRASRCLREQDAAWVANPGVTGLCTVTEDLAEHAAILDERLAALLVRAWEGSVHPAASPTGGGGSPRRE